MRVTGFTFIRNAIRFDYPVTEAILSILPVCDDFVVAVGNSDDDTLNVIRQIDPSKIHIIETVWDDSLRTGGQVLAVETNKALAAIPHDTDWAFYIQADEVVHEKYLDTIKQSMIRWNNNHDVDGLLFRYLHFFGSYDYIGMSPSWYRNEIRIIRNNRNIYSYRDAQGFRKGTNQKLRVKPVDACIYHYGWVKEPAAMQRKAETFNKLWHTNEWIDKNIAKASEFDYSNIDYLQHFNGTHPAVMASRIQAKNWTFDHDISVNRMSLKNRIKLWLEKFLNIQLGYKNYRII